MRRSLGIEMGPAGIRWVELEEERGQIAVRDSGVVTPEGAGDRATSDALRALAVTRRWSHPLNRWRRGGAGREVVVSLPRAAVTLRWVTLPRPEGARAREETAGMVELEGVQSLPFPTEDAAWDFVSFP